MKFLYLTLVFFIVFIGLFFLLSLVGLIWANYHTVINEPNWIGMYTILIGWWIALTVVIEEAHRIEYDC